MGYCTEQVVGDEAIMVWVVKATFIVISLVVHAVELVSIWTAYEVQDLRNQRKRVKVTVNKLIGTPLGG